MKIYSMTATFGKLENETLTLQPGLNILQAPNEWGKSTWCAFLLAMLYGLDTRAKSGRGALADKERYQPWSGSPMSGRMELNWQGRDITIERTTRGRIPLGIFRAYETDTGLEVPELTAANCGQQLLGIESSVYRRTGFIRLADLPVTQDDALRRRLNALVTTGDESGDGARLEKGLRELKNRCRYHQTGLLPQLEQQRDAFNADLKALTEYTARQEQLKQALEENTRRQEALQTHLLTLNALEARERSRKLSDAETDCAEAEANLRDLETACSVLPAKETAAQQLTQLNRNREALEALGGNDLPPLPKMPKVPKAFLGMDAEEAIEQAENDIQKLHNASALVWLALVLLGVLMLLDAGLLLYLRLTLLAFFSLVMGAVLLVLGLLRKRGQDRGKAALIRKYGSDDPEQWQKTALFYVHTLAEFQKQEETNLLLRAEQELHRHELEEECAALCGRETPEEKAASLQRVIRTWERLENARREAAWARRQYETLRSTVTAEQPLPDGDALEYSREETEQLLRKAQAEHQRLTTEMAEARGRMASYGSVEALRAQIMQLNGRINALEQTYSALTEAQQTLAEATAQLQRRFAPRISGRAQAILSQLTDGRYTRLTLSGDLSLHAGAVGENVLHDAQWRSEGTVDQLYLALRLAVAEELSPAAPLILDDALVRFDDKRLAAALHLLHELAESRQILLFTCQEREKQLEQNRFSSVS